MKKEIGNALALYPTPLVVVGAMVDGKPNYVLVGHLGIIGHDRIMVSLAKPHYTNKGIKQTHHLTVNMVSVDHRYPIRRSRIREMNRKFPNLCRQEKRKLSEKVQILKPIKLSSRQKIPQVHKAVRQIRHQVQEMQQSLQIRQNRRTQKLRQHLPSPPRRRKHPRSRPHLRIKTWSSTFPAPATQKP